MSEQENTNIIRVRKDARYFVASNIPFNDERLSWEARGVMGYLLSKPDSWQTRMNDLINSGPAGLRVIRRVLAELRAAGYMHRERIKTADGKFSWITTLYESPELNTMYTKCIDAKTIDGKCTDILSTDLDLKKKKEAEVFKFYQNNIELLTQYNSMILGDLIDGYTAEWVLEALKDCVEYNARNIKYCKKILEGWKANGFRSDTRSKEKSQKGSQNVRPQRNAAPNNGISLEVTPELEELGRRILAQRAAQNASV